jgi:Fuc2NAc and GlcNAc transferase
LILALWLASAVYPLLSGLSAATLWPGWFAWLLAPASVLSLVGFVDDRQGLSARLRLLVQLGMALIFLVGIHDVLAGQAWLVAPGLLALVWTMNAFNFMDGSNGMAGMQGLFSGSLLSLCLYLAGAPELALAAAAIAGVCAGFLPWNAPRARVFMGDSGSVPLGFLFAGLALLAYAGDVLVLPVVLLCLIAFHIDAGMTLLSRIRNNERWYTAHRRHVYQRLLDGGWTHLQVVALYSAINGLVVAPAMVLGTLHGNWSWAIFGAVTATLMMCWYTVSLKLGEDS